MNAYEKAAALNITGTDAEVVAVLNTLTVSDIAVDKVAIWLREAGLWYPVSPVLMAGKFQLLIDNAGTPDSVRDGLGQLYSAVFGGSADVLRTTDPTWSGLVWSIISGLTQVLPESAALVDSFYALDGGRPYKSLTAEDFASQRTAAQTAATEKAVKDGLHAIPDAAYTAFVAKYNAAKAGIDNGSLTTTSQVDAVLSGS